MSWHRLSTNPQVIEDLYGSAPPTLQGCWFYLLVLDEDRGGSLTVGVSIKQMPEVDKWPREWWSESNRVTLGLTFARVSSVQIEGWSVDNVADVDIYRADDGRSVEVKLSGAWGYVAARSESVTLSVHALKSLEGPENPYRH
jgi:hypothetical protein